MLIPGPCLGERSQAYEEESTGLGPWLGPEHGSCATARQMALVSLLLMGLRKTERISPLHSLIGQLLWRVGGMFWGTLCEDVLL